MTERKLPGDLIAYLEEHVAYPSVVLVRAKEGSEHGFLIARFDFEKHDASDLSSLVSSSLYKPDFLAMWTPDE